MISLTKLRSIEWTAFYQSLSPLLDERSRRQWAAAEARAYGWGGLLTIRYQFGVSGFLGSRGQLIHFADDEQSRHWPSMCAP